MAVTPKGVRMINNNVVQPGMALVMTDRDVMDWNHIPNGSLFVHPKTGDIMIKVEGESDWIPLPDHIKKDGTLVISRDTSLHIEVFKIISIDEENKQFTYENELGERQTKTKDENGFLFQISGSYMPGRNHLIVTFDDVLDRSAASGGIEELDEHRFRIKEDIPVGTEVTVKYIKWVRIGNPYPRIFQNEIQYLHYDKTTDKTAKRYKTYYADSKGTPLATQPQPGANIASLNYYEEAWEPIDAEVGDYFMDLRGRFDGLEDLLDEEPEDIYIPWTNITGKPTTIKGYGIVDNISYVGHLHSSNDITDLADKFQTINNKIAQLNSKIDNLNSSITTLTNKLNSVEKTVKAIPTIYVQTSQPASSAPDKSIWVNTTAASEHISVKVGSAWKKIGAVWK